MLANICIGSAGTTAVVKTYYITDAKKTGDFTCRPKPFGARSRTVADRILDYCFNLIIWAAVETGVTIISASIPFLRMLIKGNSSYGAEGTGAYTVGTHRLKSITATKNRRSIMPGRDTSSTLQVKRTDDRSDRSILSPSDSDVDGIVWTNEITVTYQEGGNDGDYGGKKHFDFGHNGV
jgi:hypothetical protein